VPGDVAVIDIVAIVWLLVVWGSYNLIMDRLLMRRVGLNQYMKDVRRSWMLRMLDRDNRITDAALVGSVMHSVSFFASATMLVMVGLVGFLSAVDQAHGALSELSFTVKTSKTLFEMKVLALLAIFIYAFLKFTWALRQFNYSCALIGAAPPAPVASPEREAAASQIAELLSLAISSFNGGLRAYYFSLAVLTWFVQPWLFIIVTGWMLMVLLRRQLLSRTFRTIRGHHDAIAAPDV
jgi:uncharacterized membrane protein